MTTKIITTKQAHKRYMWSMMGFSLGYIGSLFGVVFALNRMLGAGEIALGLQLALALIPGFFVLGMLWSFWRYLYEMDEAQRFFMMRAVVIGLFAILAVSGVWGLVEFLSDEMPRLPIFWVFPAFFLVFGLATSFGPGRGMGCK